MLISTAAKVELDRVLRGNGGPRRHIVRPGRVWTAYIGPDCPLAADVVPRELSEQRYIVRIDAGLQR